MLVGQSKLAELHIMRAQFYYSRAKAMNPLHNRAIFFPGAQLSECRDPAPHLA